MYIHKKRITKLNIYTMEKKTFKELYEAEKKKPTPAKAFIQEVAKICCVDEGTVRIWLNGQRTPSELCKKVIAERFDVEAQALFN